MISNEGPLQTTSKYQYINLKIKEEMGCQNSRLSLISNENQQPKPQAYEPEQIKKSKSKSKIYQCKQNINSHEEQTNPKNKQNSPQTISILTNDESKIHPESASKQELQLVSNAIQKIEEFQYSERKKRKQHHLKATTRAQYEAYFNQILAMLKKRQLIFQEAIEQVRRSYASHLDKQFKPQDLDRIIHHHFKAKVIPYFEVQRWLKEKLVILRIKGDHFVKWIKDICYKWKSEKELIPELLHVLIEDLVPTEKSFRIKLAFQYQYRNILEEVDQWQVQMSQIYLKIKDVIV